jgi:putative transposase
MIGQPQRQQISHDIQIAVDAGARLDRACQTIGLHPRTLKRWRINQPQHHHQIAADRRPHALRAQPAHALSEQERHTELASQIRTTALSDNLLPEGCGLSCANWRTPRSI